MSHDIATLLKELKEHGFVEPMDYENASNRSFAQCFQCYPIWPLLVDPPSKDESLPEKHVDILVAIDSI